MADKLSRKAHGCAARRTKTAGHPTKLGPVRYGIPKEQVEWSGVNIGAIANLVLQSTVERIFVPPEAVPRDHPSAATQRGLYADIQQGVFMIRGENVMLLGEIDLDKDDDAPPGYDKADPDLVKRLAKERKEADQATDKKKQKNLSALGFEGEHMGDIIL